MEELFDLWIQLRPDKKSATRFIVKVIINDMPLISKRSIATCNLPLERDDAAEIHQWINNTYMIWIKNYDPDASTGVRARELGKCLFRVLISSSDIRNSINQAWTAIHTPSTGFRKILIRLDLPEELAALPWELMHNDPSFTGNQLDGSIKFLALHEEISIVRFCPHGDARPRATVTVDQVEFAGIVAQADGEPAVVTDLAHYIKSIQDKIQKRARNSSFKWIYENDTFGELERALEEGVNILDIICHGQVKENSTFGETGQVLFVDRNAQPRPVTATRLANVLRNRGQKSIELTMLKCCAGAYQSGRDMFSSIGATLASRLNTDVVAMQFLITVEAASILSQHFYGKLVDTCSIVAALAASRFELLERIEKEPFAWAIPVLYLQTKSGILLSGNHRGPQIGITYKTERSPAHTIYRIEKEQWELEIDDKKSDRERSKYLERLVLRLASRIQDRRTKEPDPSFDRELEEDITRFYWKASVYDPDNGKVHVNFARYHFSSNNLHEAKNLCDEARSCYDAANRDGNYQYIPEQDYIELNNLYNQIIQRINVRFSPVDPEDVESEEIRRLHSQIREQPKSHLYWKLARQYYREGRLDDADFYCDKGRGLDSDSVLLIELQIEVLEKIINTTDLEEKENEAVIIRIQKLRARLKELNF